MGERFDELRARAQRAEGQLELCNHGFERANRAADALKARAEAAESALAKAREQARVAEEALAGLATKCRRCDGEGHYDLADNTGPAKCWACNGTGRNFCDHAARPCDRCDAAEAALAGHPGSGLVERTRKEALEEAARVVENAEIIDARGVMGSYYAQLGDAKATLKVAATAIRALSTPAVAPTEEK